MNAHLISFHRIHSTFERRALVSNAVKIKSRGGDVLLISQQLEQTRQLVVIKETSPLLFGR